MSKLSRFVRPYRIERARGFRLKDIDPGDSAGIPSDRKEEAAALLADGVKRMAALQDKLYAQDRWSLLLIFQALDAAGKDSVIKHVLSGINPQGCQIFSFKAPSAQERDHDFMWRNMRTLPERGRIGIFNRSYYEEVLIVRVHPNILAGENLPDDITNKKDLWEHRYESIVEHEKHLRRNGTKVIKFFLHISREEQAKRFIDRIDKPKKQWKFSEGDIHEREYWDDYMQAYSEAISATSTEHAPWYVIPADDKKNVHLLVSTVVLETLRSFNLEFPELPAEELAGLKVFRDQLIAESPGLKLDEASVDDGDDEPTSPDEVNGN